MAFVYERLCEEDKELFYSMKIKNCWGDSPLLTPNKWCADKENNAYLIGVGGGYKDMPYFYDLWWNGYTIRMEISDTSMGNYNVGVDVIWNILKIHIPSELFDRKEDIVRMIKDAFSINPSWCKPEFLKSITVNIECEAETVKEIK